MNTVQKNNNITRKQVQELLEENQKKLELSDRHLINKTVFKNEAISDGYYIVVLVFIQNLDGKFFKNHYEEFEILLHWLEQNSLKL